MEIWHNTNKIKAGKLAFSLLVIFILSLLSSNKTVELLGNQGSKVKGTHKIHKIIKVNKNAVLAEEKPSFVVCIDPGHGNYDNGAKGVNGVFEKSIALNVGLKVGQALENNGIKVVYTRKDDATNLGSGELQNLQKRVQISNDSKANVFVSIHCNDFDNSSVRGIELWCNDPNTKDEELAKKIESGLLALNYSPKRNMKYRSNRGIYVLKNNKAISTLVELGYISNPDDCKFLTSDSGQAQCANAIANAIIDFKKGNAK